MKALHDLLTLALIPFAVLLAACSSSPDTPGDGAPETPAAPIEGITGQIVHIEWRNLNPKRPDAPLGLINHSSPEMKQLYAKPAAWQHVKPVDDEVMGMILEQLRQSGFFDNAVKGPTLDSFKVGVGQHGLIHVRKGDENWALLFTPGMYGTAVPQVYSDCKTAILEVHRRTMWLAPSAPQDPDRVFRMPTSKPRGR